ncbi:MAG: FAD-dependent oxidoreductase [Desulfobacterales bacterium]|nr:FAD-dependent oxidoreductase [Desulfobacterales bacterium]
MADIRTSIGGLDLENPILVSSGPLTDTDEILRKVEDFGAGGVILKTGLVDEDYQKAITPYEPQTYGRCLQSYIRCHDGQMHCDSMSRWPIERWAEWINNNKDKYGMKIIASVGGISLEGYAKGVKLFEEAGADAVEVLVACPAPWFWPFKYTMTTDPEVIKEIATITRESAKKIRIGAKIFPWPRKLTYIIRDLKFHWVTLGGVFIGAPEIDLNRIEPKFVSDASMAGTGPAKHMALRAMMHAPDVVREMDISAHGGIHSWREVAEMILYGASSVQAHTLFMRHGLRPINEIKKGLADYMDEKGFVTIKDMRGSILSKLIDWPKITSVLEQTYPRLKGTVVSEIDPDKCRPPCRMACPIDTDIKGYLGLAREGKIDEAYQLIRLSNPIPAVCGRVCHHPCEQACKRDYIDESLGIKAIKRFITEKVDTDSLPLPIIPENDKKVAIIGSGPAGLACAHDLALKGFRITIFESQPEAGGMLRAGIPEYRLPRGLLDKDIGFLKRLGIDIRTSSPVDAEAMETLKNDYDALFVATGAHREVKLDMPGETSRGVLPALDFLKAANRGDKVEVGDKTVIIGGGNSAIDAARLARRLEASSVTILYLFNRENMEAAPEEVAKTEKEGIVILFLAAPSRIITENGRVSALECVRVNPGEPDASGMPEIIPIKGTEFVIDVDTLIPALGQMPDQEIKQWDLNISTNNVIETDDSMATNISGVFAGGDIATGTTSVVDALASGKKAARAIDCFIKGEVFEDKTSTAPSAPGQEEIASLVQRFPKKQRINAPEVDLAGRLAGAREVELTYSPAQAREEASRCMECGGCRICWQVCPFDAISIENGVAVSDPEKCDGCNMCVMACPVNAITLKNENMYVQEARRIAGISG